MNYKLHKLIEDVKNSNYIARVFVLLQMMSDSLYIPGAGAWCLTEENCYEDAGLYLNVKALTDAIGDLLIDDDDDFILPVSYKLCYLSKARCRMSSDYYEIWWDVNSTHVTARARKE